MGRTFQEKLDAAKKPQVRSPHFSDADSYRLLSRCRRAMLQAGWPKEPRDALVREMMAGDYTHAYEIAQKHFDIR